MRKFAKVTLIAEKDLEKGTGQSLHLANIGPDPLDKRFTFNVFKERLARKSTGRIKTVLMDQSIIAGIGNIYSDEALWRAGIHPEERVKNIFARNDSDALAKKLYTAVIAVLKKGIDFGGDSMSDYRNIHGKRGRFQEQHHAYRKTGERCSMMIREPHGNKARQCKGVITRKIVGGRSAHFCSVHQRLLS
jgi:formamidopyrimidine-DNA glycosylase